MFSYDNQVVQADMKRLSALDFTPFRYRRVLITGVTGMLATYLACALLYMNDTQGLNIQVTGLARHREKAERRFGKLLDRPDFTLLVQDVTEPIVSPTPFDCIFHLAGSASAAAIAAAPTDIILANVLGTKNVLEAAAGHPGTKVFFASTREVYGRSEETVLREETQGTLDMLSPRSCYPESKRMAENLCAVYHDQRGVPVCIARIAHSYGPGMQLANDGRIMADLLGNASRGEDIVLKSDGSARRAFCYITDAAAAIFTAFTHTESWGVFNIANETEEVSVRELAELVAAAVPGLGVTFAAPPADSGRAYFNVPRVRLSTEKIEALGWRPQVSLRDGIAYTLKSLF